MKGKSIVGLFVFITIILVGAVSFFTYVGKNDKEISMREQIVSQQEVSKANFDNMFKTIAQVASVPTEFMNQSKQAFKEIYQPLIEGRYQDKSGNQQQVLMKWVQESNPQFDMGAAKDLYAKIQQVVEIKRNEFFNEQKKLIAYHQSHTTFCKTFFNAKLFGMGEREIPKCDYSLEPNDVFCVQIITSGTTKETFRTGEENDVSLF